MLLTLPHHRLSISYELWAEDVSRRPSFKLFFQAFYLQLQKNESWFWGWNLCCDKHDLHFLAFRAGVQEGGGLLEMRQERHQSAASRTEHQHIHRDAELQSPVL